MSCTSYFSMFTSPTSVVQLQHVSEGNREQRRGVERARAATETEWRYLCRCVPVPSFCWCRRKHEHWEQGEEHTI